MLDKLKNTYPEKHDKPTANNMPNKFITVSIFISFLFFNACQIAPPIITANGPKYRINPITPKLQIKAGNSISITNSPVWFLYPFPNNINNGFFCSLTKIIL